MVTTVAKAVRRALSVAGVVLALSRPHYCPAAQEGDLRIRVKDEKTGKETALYRKLLVATDGVTFHAGKPDAPAKAVSPLSIFHHLYADDKRTAESLEKGGKLLLRVGKRDGAPVGWLEVAKPSDPKQGLSPDVVVWNTRFVLQPQPNPGREPFRLYKDPACKDELAEAALDGVPAGHRLVAPILRQTGGEEGLHEIAFFSGKVRTSARPAVANEPGKSEALKLEIVFVIGTARGKAHLIETAKEVVTRCVDWLEKMPELKGQVRFGLVEYQDVAPGLFSSRLVSPLTEDLRGFLRDKLTTLKEAAASSRRAPNDVLAGLKTAVTESGWGKNSSRHILLVGDSSAHVSAGACSQACAHDKDPKTGTCNGNSTGLDVKRIIDLGRPSAAAGRAAHSITFSAVRFKGEDPADHAKCREQFQELTRNRGQVEGKYVDVEDSNKAEDRQKVVVDLTDFLLAGFNTLQKARLAGGNTAPMRKLSEGTPPNAASAPDNKSAKSPIVELKSVMYGFTVDTTAKGDQVAEVCVLVERQELEELRAAVDLYHTRLKGLGNPERHRNTGAILAGLKCAVATAVIGQVVSPDASQNQLLAGLPATTRMLNNSAERVARMPEKEFLGWLADLEGCKKRYEELLQSKDWIDVNDGSTAEKYMFLPRTELP